MSAPSRFKIAVVVGTRPELIRLSRVLAALDRTMALTLIHTGQNYDPMLSEVFFADLAIRKPDYFLGASGKNAVQTIAQILERVDPVLEAVDPDALLVLGDTNSCLSVLAAKRRRIPVFHMEAGNRCFDERVPEEINRRIVDHTSDVNLTYSEHARRYLLAEGLPGDRIIKTGSPMYEVLHFYAARIERSDVVERLGLTPYRYIVLSAHREENVDAPDSLAELGRSLDRVCERYDLPIVVSTHPRTRKRLNAAGIVLDPRVRLLEPFGFLDYIQLQKHAFVVLSDSGTITEESSILDFPAVNIRESHERPEGMDEASVPLSGLNAERIEACIDLVTAAPRDGVRRFAIPADYAAPNVSEKVVRLVLSYTDYVRRTVWQETGPTFRKPGRE